MKKAPPFLPRSALFITLGFNIDMAVEKIKGLPFDRLRVTRIK
jgi:hypothetical protein